MNNLQRWIVVLCLPLLAQCQSATQPLAFNQIQFMGSHNSYKQAIEPALMQVLRQSNPQAAIALDYAHVSLPAQLDLGLRKLELDVFYDPLGGRYATPAGLQMAPGQSVFDPQGEMTKPGFKVLHVQDLDFRSQCQRFEHCLAQIRRRLREFAQQCSGADDRLPRQRIRRRFAQSRRTARSRQRFHEQEHIGRPRPRHRSHRIHLRFWQRPEHEPQRLQQLACRNRLRIAARVR